MQYRIRIKGQLALSWQSWFAPLQIGYEAPETTILAGTLPDQSALYGVLLKIDRLGVSLISVESSEALQAARVAIEDTYDSE